MPIYPGYVSVLLHRLLQAFSWVCLLPRCYMVLPGGLPHERIVFKTYCSSGLEGGESSSLLGLKKAFTDIRSSSSWVRTGILATEQVLTIYYSSLNTNHACNCSGLASY